jgi:ribosome assembly protein YihI (activator of Der GTPase)
VTEREKDLDWLKQAYIDEDLVRTPVATLMAHLGVTSIDALAENHPEHFDNMVDGLRELLDQLRDDGVDETPHPVRERRRVTLDELGTT